MVLIRNTLTALAVVAAAVVSGEAPIARATSTSADLAPRVACPGQAATAAPVAVQLRAMRCLINWARSHNGRTPLRVQTELDRSSSLRGNDIRRCGDFSHTPCGQPFLVVFTVVHYLTGAGGVGENLAWGQGRRGSARAAIAMWLASPVHRQVLFAGNWRDLGVSLVKARSLFGRSNVSLWVAQFGHRPAALIGP